MNAEARAFFGFSPDEPLDLIGLNSRMFNVRREHKNDPDKLAAAKAFFEELKGEIEGKKPPVVEKSLAPEKSAKEVDIAYSGLIRELMNVAGKAERDECPVADYRRALDRLFAFLEAHPTRVQKDQVCRILTPTGDFLRKRSPETVEVVNQLFEKLGRAERLLTDAEETSYMRAARPLADLAHYRDRSVIPDSLNTVVKLAGLLTEFSRFLRREERIAAGKKKEVADLMAHFGTSSLVGGLYVGEMGHVNRCVRSINGILEAVGSEFRYEELDPSDYVGRHRLDEPLG